MNKPSGLRQEGMLVEIKFNDKKFKTKFMTQNDNTNEHSQVSQ